MRKMVLVVMALLLAAGTAFADQNPDILIGLDSTNPPVGVNRIDDPATNFYVYVVFTHFGDGGGLLGASFKFERTFSGFKLTQENLLGGLDLGDVEGVNGWAITSGANCAYPTGDVLVAARIQYLWTGTAGTIQILPHGQDGSVIADCDNELDVWSTYSNFGVNADAPESPVEPTSWTSIKALYR